MAIWADLTRRFGPAKVDIRRRKMRISSQLKATPPNIHFKYDAIYCLTERSESSNWIETLKQNEICKTKVSSGGVAISADLMRRCGPAKVDIGRRKMCISSQLKVTVLASPNRHP